MSVVSAHLPPTVRRVAMLAVHSSPLARIGGPSAGGMNVYVRELARELAGRGARVDIFTRQELPDAPCVTVVAPGVSLIALPCGPFGVVDKGTLLPHIPAFAAAVHEWTQANRRTYDLIHAHYWLSGVAGDLLRCRWDVPLLMTFHTLARAKAAAMDDNSTESAQRVLGERRLVHQADAILAFNPQERAEMTWFYHADQGKVCIVPAGYDATIFTPGSRSDARRDLGFDQHRPIVLFVGRIDPIKGIDVLVDAMCGLRRELWQTAPPLLTVVGGGVGEPPYDALVNRARMLDLNEMICFRGSVAHDELPAFYRAANVVAAPSFYESFGLVALEAMACGTPVVASRAGGLAYTIDDGLTGMLVPQNDPAVLADTLRSVLTDDVLRYRLGANAAIAARRYAWPIVAGQVAHVYDQLIRGCRLDLCAGMSGAAMTGGM